MSTGRGVIHSEMPKQVNGLMRGFQLWINLPAAQKMSDPDYLEFTPAGIPEVEAKGARVRVLAGEHAGVQGAVRDPNTDVLYLDVALPAGSTFQRTVPAGHNAFVYVYRGEADVAGTAVPAQRMAILANSADADGVVIEAKGEARVLLIAGRPLNEPIAQYGPFVMNTEQEIHQALQDFREGRLA